MHIHTFGKRGDLVDEHGYFRSAYAVTAGDWVLIRPDGYLGAIVSSAGLVTLESYLRSVGLGLLSGGAK